MCQTTTDVVIAYAACGIVQECSLHAGGKAYVPATLVNTEVTLKEDWAG